MKGTKLWQAPGSPVIQGLSRHRRSFLNVWAVSCFASASALVTLIGFISAFPGDTGMPLAESIAFALSLSLPALPGLMAGSAAGVGLARALGSRRQWAVGIVAGLLLGVTSMMLLVAELTVRGVTFK